MNKIENSSIKENLKVFLNLHKTDMRIRFQKMSLKI